MQVSQTIPLVDSHCHLNGIDLSAFGGSMDALIQEAKTQGVEHMLSVCVEPSDVSPLYSLAEQYQEISISVGIHPNTEMTEELDATALCSLANHSSCIAIGETGLDYYRTETEEAKALQRSRFREHIRAARSSLKPLIIHTRQAAEDTLSLMQEENADSIGGVMHCFSEDWQIARRALDLNFYISFSGILTFKNATLLQEVAKKIPEDKILIETDSPYLAPVPFRGKSNHPAWVKYVALALSQLRGVSYDTMARKTTENFYRCFHMKGNS